MLNLSELRRNKTKKALAKELNISEKTYANYENGVSEPNISTLCKLADYFGVSLDYLCCRQYNNNIGYIPDDKKDGVIKLLKLEDNEFQKAVAYITAILDIQKG